MAMELPVSGVPSLSPDPSPKGEEKTKTGINPLRRMQNVSYEPWTL